MRKTNNKDYKIPARFTDIVVIRDDPNDPPLPKWKREIWAKVKATKDIKEKNKLLELIYGPPSETMKRTMELFKDVA